MGYLTVEVIRIPFDQLSSMPNASPDPVIAVEGEKSLSKAPGIILLSMKDVFGAVSEFLFQSPLKWSKKKSDETLTKIVKKVQRQTGWTWNDAMFAIFVRDFIRPGIEKGLAATPSGLEDTLRLYVTIGDDLRFASFPYHSPSLALGDVVPYPPAGGADGDGYTDGYPSGDYDLGDPG